MTAPITPSGGGGEPHSSPVTAVRKLLGAFYKTVDVMKSARNSESKTMNVWADDMKAVEDVLFFLENIRDSAPAQCARLRETLAAIIQMDDDAAAAHGKPHANLNGYGLVDLFDSVGHPFGAGEHKQQPYRSNNLEAALADARAALAAGSSLTSTGCEIPSSALAATPEEIAHAKTLIGQDLYRWPIGCHSPNSCHRNGRCMYVGCKHDGKDIKALAVPQHDGGVA